jgi:hypothetical protein
MLGSRPQGNDGILQFAVGDFLGKGVENRFLFRRATMASCVAEAILCSKRGSRVFRLGSRPRGNDGIPYSIRVIPSSIVCEPIFAILKYIFF